MIIEGYRDACKSARAALEASSKDRSNEQEAFKMDLMNIARTTLSSKVLAQDKEHFAKIAVEAILRLTGKKMTICLHPLSFLQEDLDLEHIQVIKKVEVRLAEYLFLDDGFILDKKIGVNQPKVASRTHASSWQTLQWTRTRSRYLGRGCGWSQRSNWPAIERAEREKMQSKGGVDKEASNQLFHQ